MKKDKIELIQFKVDIIVVALIIAMITMATTAFVNYNRLEDKYGETTVNTEETIEINTETN